MREAAERRGVKVPPLPHTPAVLGELAASVYLHPVRGARRVPREVGYLQAARKKALRTSAGELAAWEWGAADAPLVGLMHGWEGHGAQLGAFAAPLVAAGFRVLAFDAPGHGDSPGEELSVPSLARILTEIAASEGPWHAGIGHSMGAAAVASAADAWASASVAASKSTDAGASACGGGAMRGLVLLAPPQSQLERLERVAARLELAPDVQAEFFAAVVRRTGATFDEADLRVVARRAPCPVCVFHDPADEDASFEKAQEVVGLWRGARLVPCPGRGHYRILATPEIVRQAVEFIAGLR